MKSHAKLLTVLLSFALLSVFIPIKIKAGVLMRTVAKTEKPAGTTTIISYIEPDRLRLETQGQDFDAVAIFRADKKIFWAINKREGTYVEMTEESVQKMGSQMTEMMKQMQEQMANLPPEQRQMMEQMMRQMTPSPARPPKVTSRRLGSGGKINNFPTDKYELYENGKKSMEIWATEWKNLGLSPDDFKVFEQFGKFMEKMGGPFARMTEYRLLHKEDYGIKGFPVRSVQYERGAASFVSDLKEVRKERLASSLFELPPGLRKVEEPGPTR